MTTLAQKLMTAEEFLAWAGEREIIHHRREGSGLAKPIIMREGDFRARSARLAPRSRGHFRRVAILKMKKASATGEPLYAPALSRFGGGAIWQSLYYASVTLPHQPHFRMRRPPR
jgi:hypothetical protein